jgi:hypothetical protein
LDGNGTAIGPGWQSVAVVRMKHGAAAFLWEVPVFFMSILKKVPLLVSRRFWVPEK